MSKRGGAPRVFWSSVKLHIVSVSCHLISTSRNTIRPCYRWAGNTPRPNNNFTLCTKLQGVLPRRQKMLENHKKDRSTLSIRSWQIIFDERVRDLKLKDLQDLIDFQITLNSAAILHTIRRATQKDRIHDRVLDDILV